MLLSVCLSRHGCCCDDLSCGVTFFSLVAGGLYSGTDLTFLIGSEYGCFSVWLFLILLHVPISMP